MDRCGTLTFCSSSDTDMWTSITLSPPIPLHHTPAARWSESDLASTTCHVCQCQSDSLCIVRHCPDTMTPWSLSLWASLMIIAHGSSVTGAGIVRRLSLALLCHQRPISTTNATKTTGTRNRIQLHALFYCFQNQQPGLLNSITNELPRRRGPSCLGRRNN